LRLKCYSVAADGTMLCGDTPMPWDEWLLHAVKSCDVDVMEHLEDGATVARMKAVASLPDSLFVGHGKK
jgi:hypothetical protein